MREIITDTRPIRLAFIRIDGGTQPRAAIAEDVVADYAEAMTDGKQFPPLDVFFDGVDYWLADGFHRYHAAKRIGLVEVPSKMQAGTQRDAVLFSVGVNHEHGLQRTSDDKRKAITTLIEDPEWGVWSDREILRRVGVSGGSWLTFIAKEKSRHYSEKDSDPIVRTYTTKHGREATMQVGNIGRPKMSPDKRAEIERRITAGEHVGVITREMKVSQTTVYEIRKALGLRHGVDKTPSAVAARREQMREMADQGYSTRQIAKALGVTEECCRRICRELSIDVPADRSLAQTARHDSNRILQTIVTDAENLTVGIDLIDFGSVDCDQLRTWIDSLIKSRATLSSFIRRLSEEHKKHGEAA